MADDWIDDEGISFDELAERVDGLPRAEVDRLPEIRKAVKQGYVGHLLAQRDYWRDVAVYLLGVVDGADEERKEGK